MSPQCHRLWAITLFHSWIIAHVSLMAWPHFAPAYVISAFTGHPQWSHFWQSSKQAEHMEASAAGAT